MRLKTHYKYIGRSARIKSKMSKTKLKYKKRRLFLNPGRRGMGNGGKRLRLLVLRSLWRRRSVLHSSGRFDYIKALGAHWQGIYYDLVAMFPVSRFDDFCLRREADHYVDPTFGGGTVGKCGRNDFAGIKPGISLQAVDVWP